MEEERVNALREKFFRQCRINHNLKECMDQRRAAEEAERLRANISDGILIGRSDTDDKGSADKVFFLISVLTS